MPRKATAKEKPAPPQESMKRPRRQSAKKDAVTSSGASGEPLRSRRSSTAAQTAASVADATRGTRSSSRSQSGNRQNSSDRKSTSRETSLEPADTPRSSSRIIKKINYQESEGEEEEAPAKNVENVEEEDYNAEEDVDNDSDSRESGRNKLKGKVKSPPGRSRGRPARTKAAKVETPVKASPGRGRRAKTVKKPAGENEADFVAPSRRGRYDDNAEEGAGDKNVERVRASSRSTRGTRAARQAATPRTAPQRPKRTSRRQQNLDESKEEEEDEDEEEEEEEEEEKEEEPEEKEKSDEKKDDVDSPPAKKKPDNDEISSTNEKAPNGVSSAKKRKSEDESESKKKRMKLEESKTMKEKVEEEGSNEGDSEEEEEPMEVDEVDVSKESKSSSGPSESTDKETTPKPVSELPAKEEPQDNEKKADKDKESIGKKDAPTEAVEVAIKVAQKCEPVSNKDLAPDKKVDDFPETKPKLPQTSELKSVITQVPSTPKPGTGMGTGLQSTKDQPLALTPEKKKVEPLTGEEKSKTPPVVPEEKKAVSTNVVESVVKPPSNQVPISLPENRSESKSFPEYDSKPRELQPHIVSRPMEGIRCEGGTFNGCEAPPENVVLSSHPEIASNLSQPRVPLPSSVVGNAANISNSLGTIPANSERQPEGKLGSNGVHCNQNIGPKPRGRKYVAAGNIKEDEKLAHKDRTFSCVSHNLSGDFMQAEKLLLELKSQLSEIVCLQEVSEDVYRSHLKNSFESLGYRLLFNLPFGQKTGLATLYKTNLFSLKHHKELSLKDIIAKDMDASGSSREEKTAVIEHLKNCGHMLLTHLMFNGRHLMVANVSVPPTDLGAHTLQMSCVARETLNSLEGTTRPLIICGTFNMQENNAAYQLLRDGYLSNDMIELLQSKKDITFPGGETTALVNLLWKSFQHSAAALNSCYASVMGSELQVHGQSATRPDLMWYSSDCLKVFGILGDVESSEQATSTHLLLKADLAFSI